LILTLLLALTMPEPVAGLVGGAFLWVLFGLPVDSWFRTGRVSTTLTWALFPWFTGWFCGYALEHLADQASLWHVSVFERVPAFLRHSAGLPGFAVGLVGCALIEQVENRTGKTPTALPLKAFGAFFAFWLVSAVAAEKLHLSKRWRDGQFLFPFGAFCLGWLAVRVARTVLNANAARQAIEERKGSA